MSQTQQDIIHTLNRYACACDSRDWSLFDDVFADNVHAVYGGYEFNSRAEVISIIKNSLGGCGPTQHLLGNYDVTVDAAIAKTKCYVRASHYGLGEHDGELYEVWGEYCDTLQSSHGQWLIIEREFRIYNEIGSRRLLKPA